MKGGKYVHNTSQNDYTVFIQIIFTPKLEIIISNRGKIMDSKVGEVW